MFHSCVPGRVERIVLTKAKPRLIVTVVSEVWYTSVWVGGPAPATTVSVQVSVKVAKSKRTSWSGKVSLKSACACLPAVTTRQNQKRVIMPGRVR
jgi:hypothetical protein